MIWTWGRLAEGRHCRPVRSRTPGSLQATLLAALAAALIFPGSAAGAEDTQAPKLVSLQFSPTSIKTSTGPAEVTISFAATDDASGVNYIETGFVDASGIFRRQGAARFAPVLTATGSVRIAFPRFSNAGDWTLSHVVLSDAAGNTMALDTDGLRDRRFATRLEVISAQDTVSPKLTALNFAPARIDTSARDADVKVQYTATDDLAGVDYVELSFVSPSGTIRRGDSAKLDAARSVSNSITVTFPRLSESGEWTLRAVYLADAAGNTVTLDTAEISGLGFRTTLEVKSAPDTIAPNLTALRFEPSSINTTQGPATAKVEFTATDSLSGVASLEVSFASPSGTTRLNGSKRFSPAPEVTDSVLVTFPQSSEPGAWTLGSVVLADAAGNALALEGAGMSFGPRTLEVKATLDTASPNLASFRLAPAAIDTSRGPATVKVVFTATDNLSGVKSLEVVFASPSGTAMQRGSATFSPATEVTDSVNVTFPQSSEPGAWMVGSVVVTDGAGNSLVLIADEVASKGAKPLQVR